MSIRSYTLNKVLARLSAQDREEALQRAQSQRDAQNNAVITNLIPQVIGTGLDVAGKMSDKAEADFLKNVEADTDFDFADQYGQELAAQEAALREKGMGASAATAGTQAQPLGVVPTPAAVAGVPAALVKPKNPGDFTVTPADFKRGVGAVTKIDILTGQPVVAPTPGDAALRGLSRPPAETPPLEPKKIPITGETVAAPAGPVGRLTGAVRPNDKINAGAIPQAESVSALVTRTFDLAQQLRRNGQPQKADDLEKISRQLSADPSSITAYNAAGAMVQGVNPEDLKIKGMNPDGPAPQKSDLPVSTDNQAAKDAAATAAALTKDTPASGPSVRAKYKKDFDEIMHEPNFPDPKKVANDRVEALLDEQYRAKPGTWERKAQDMFGIFGVNEKTIALSKKLAARRIMDHQNQTREKAVQEAQMRVKLSELNNTKAEARDRAISSMGVQAREFEKNQAMDFLRGGPKGEAVAKAALIKDPDERAAALYNLIQAEDLPAGLVSVSAQSVRGALLADMMDAGDGWNWEKSAKPKTDKIIEPAILEKLTTARGAIENLSLADPSDRSELNKVLGAIGTISGTAEEIATKSVAAFRDNPKAQATDARIKRNIAAYLKSTSGLATTDAEYKRIWESAPNESDSPGTYYAKLNDFIGEIERYHNNTLNLARDSGRNIGDLKPIKGQMFGPEGSKLIPTKNTVALDRELE